VEPFAGGSSVALQLLNEDLVEKIVLGEKDPLVSSFWKIVFGEPEWLISEISKMPLTLKKWKYFKDNSFTTNRERALACIFLNRTSFSGIIAPGSGPIGGYRQKSQYKIDCRFNIETLAKRIRQAASLRDRVLYVERADWKATISKTQKLKFKANEVFYYLDPPFFFKANRLYTYYFNLANHIELRDTLVGLRQPWLLSYDKADEIIHMYSTNGYGPRHIDILYSIGSGSQSRTQEAIITNLPRLPKETRIWMSKEEWRR
jgi:DNA adenine methylase